MRGIIPFHAARLGTRKRTRKEEEARAALATLASLSARDEAG
jgi:hypothetical protein